MASLSMISEPGLDVYLILRNNNSLLWNAISGALESYNVGNYSQYGMGGVEQGNTGYYYAGTPATLPSGYYRTDWRDRVLSSGVESDICVANGSAYWNMIEWNTTNTISSSDTSSTVNVNVGSIASGVWDMSTIDHTYPTNSFGQFVQLIKDDTNLILDGYEDSSVTTTAIASGVWNMLTTQAGASGSYGELLNDGLSVTGIVDANIVSISGVPVNIDSNSVADSDELSVLGNLLLRNARIIRLLP